MAAATSIASAPLAIIRDVALGSAMAHGRAFASRLGFSPISRTKIEIMISELNRQILDHADGIDNWLIEPVHQTIDDVAVVVTITPE